jgi:Tol biopolymer transport system component
MRIAALLLLGATALYAGPALAQSASELKTKHEGNAQYPRISPDSTRIAYEVNYPADKRTELYMATYASRALTGEPALLVPESMSSPSRYGATKRITHEFAWARKGDFAYAYTVTNAQGVQQIYVDNWSQFVAEGESANKEAAWDPKAGRFVFTSSRTGNGDLYLWESGSTIQLTYDELNAELYPSWHPTQDKVLFVSAGKAEQYIQELDLNMFSHVKLVDFGGADMTRPCYSPDGSKIAFFSNKGAPSVTQWGLWVMDARPGSTPKRVGPLVSLPSKGTAPWTPDGKGLIAAVDDPDAGDPIAVIPVDGGAQRNLATGTFNNRDPNLFVQDGTWRIVFTSQGLDSKAEKTWQKLFVYDIPR